MIQANFKYWKIDSGDIWAYERNLFLSNKSTEEQAKILIDRIQTSLVKNKSYSFNITDSENKNSNGLVYLSKQREIYTEACKELKSQFEIDYFIEKDNLYEYSTSIVLKKTDVNFNYWFALKGKQYESDLEAIPKFLGYQLEQVFKKNTIEFKEFLEHLILQFKNDLLNEDIVSKIQKWINDKLNTEIKQQHNPSSNYRTFYLKILKEKPDFLEETKVRIQLIDILNELKQSNFIDGSTSILQFLKLFKIKPFEKSALIS